MARKLVLAFAAMAALVLATAGISLVLIRSGLQRYSDDAMARFPGADRTAALIRVVECEHCPLTDRNHAVWALGQMAEPRALPVLQKHHDGLPCAHERRLCQHELRKAIQMVETRGDRSGAVAQWIGRLHQPWR